MTGWVGQGVEVRDCIDFWLSTCSFLCLCPTQFLVTPLPLPPHRSLWVGVGRPLAPRILTLSPLFPFPSPQPPPSLHGQARMVACHPGSLACSGQCSMVPSASFCWGWKFFSMGNSTASTASEMGEVCGTSEG